MGVKNIRIPYTLDEFKGKLELMAALEILNVVEKTLVTSSFSNQGIKKEREMANSTDKGISTGSTAGSIAGGTGYCA